MVMYEIWGVLYHLLLVDRCNASFIVILRNMVSSVPFIWINYIKCSLQDLKNAVTLQIALKMYPPYSLNWKNIKIDYFKT